jgi:hypothetical protein
MRAILDTIWRCSRSRTGCCDTEFVSLQA